MQAKPLTRDEALLAVHDHCGWEVEVVVEVTDSLAMAVEGVLHHWSASLGARATTTNQAELDDLTGLYYIDGQLVNIAKMDAARLVANDGEPSHGIDLDLADGVVLHVVWGHEPPAPREVLRRP